MFRNGSLLQLPLAYSGESDGGLCLTILALVVLKQSSQDPEYGGSFHRTGAYPPLNFWVKNVYPWVAVNIIAQFLAAVRLPIDYGVPYFHLGSFVFLISLICVNSLFT